MDASGDFRGQGWRMPVRPDAAGGLGYVDGDENVVQSLELMLRTVAGERLMRPEFGTTVADLLFAGDSEQNLHRLEVAVDEAIRQWEPRVEVNEVVASRSPVSDTAVDVAVTYLILRTNTKRNLVFPFYLEAGDDVVSLPELLLDTLTWADLVEIARRRIGEESAGKWTLHAPVDPGITLLELFAYELEQRLYVLDQTPDVFVRAALDLLGVDPPRPAFPATTVLRIEARTNGETVLAAGTSVELRLGGVDGQRERVVLTTERALCAIPGARVQRVVVDGNEAETALERSEPTGFFPRPGGSTVLIEVAHDSYRVAGSASIAFYVEPVTPREYPDTAPDGPVLGWHRRSADGGDSPVLLDQDRERPPIGSPFSIEWRVDGQAVSAWDGSAGFRYPGIIELPIASSAPAGTIAVEISADRPASIPTPAIARIVPNAVVARHRRTIRIRVPSTERSAAAAAVAAWLPVPGVSLPLADAIGSRPGEDAYERVLDDPATVSLRLSERDGHEHEWRCVSDLAFEDRASRVFVVDREGGQLVFGDGIHGRVPRLAPEVHLDASIEVGGGDLPEIGADRSWRVMRDDRTDDDRVAASNIVPVDGGRDPEAIGAAARRAAQDVERRFVAVTAEDYRTVIRARVPELADARVHVVPQCDPERPRLPIADSVTVVCVPFVPRPIGEVPSVPCPLLDDGARLAAATVLRDSRLVGTQVYLRDPVYCAVELDVQLVGAYGAAQLQHRLHAGLARYLDAVVGGGDGTGWQLGAPLRPTELLARAQVLAGSRHDVRTVAVRVPAIGRCEDCDPIELGRLSLPYVTRLNLSGEVAA